MTTLFDRFIGYFGLTRRDVTTINDVEETYTPYSLQNLYTTRYFEEENSPAKTDGTRVAIQNQAIKSPEIRAILRTQALGIFGSGLTIQFIHKNKELTKTVEWFFKEWQKKENCDLQGMRSFTDMLDLASDEIQRAGGVIYRHHYNPEWKFGYKIEIIPVANIDFQKHDPQKNLFNGHQLDKDGARSGIWFKNSTTSESVFVSASELVVYIPMWVDAKQLTPVAMLTPIALQLKSLDDYRNSEVQMSIKAANRPFFWFTQLFSDVLGKARNTFQQNGSSDKTSAAAAEQIKTLASSKLTKEQLVALPQDDKIQQVVTDRAPILDSLREESGEAIAGAVGTPVSFLRNSAKGNNFASLKALTQIFEKQCEKDFGKFIEHIIRDVIAERLLKMAPLVGVPISVINNPREWEITYMPTTGRIDISPQDSMKQHTAGLEAGITTIDSIATKAGMTGDELMQQVADEKAKQEYLLQEARKKYGLPDTQPVVQQTPDTNVQEQSSAKIDEYASLIKGI